MMMSEQKYICIHEQRLGEAENRLTELETRADYKDKRIDDLKDKMDEIDDKLDTIAENVHLLQLQSVQDDKDIDKRVTSLETTVNVLKWIITLLFGSGLVWIIFTYIK